MTPRAADIALALAVTGVISAAVAAGQASTVPAGPLPYLWAICLGALMLLRRTAPVLVLVLTALGYFAYYSAGFPAIGVAVPIAAAVYSAAEAGHLRIAIVIALTVLTVSTTYRLLIGQSTGYVLGYELVGHAALIAAVVALGSSVRAHRALRERTDQVASLTAHQAILQAEGRTRAERLRLARELHDSIGHCLAVASLHTNVAREANSETDRTHALRLVREAVGEAMTQLRSTVTLLRSSASELDSGTLADIPRLVDAPGAAGYKVELDVAEDLSCSATVEATAFRLVQEAITNTLRHADAGAITVRVVAEGEDRIKVAVSDDGVPARPPSCPAGHGLAGMRERVEAVGGSLEVRATADGWQVTALLPKEDRS
ncbi:signal transduction histidine kinase [Kribbella amoyensis]|uniref:histidine kinase n=2 Tax=Kribbella amoyensis TaxID=996641 RepID=A0A561BTJ2_9ACTN|nr:signal transduction histidine kinase [Kribbella amoyensis]